MKKENICHIFDVSEAKKYGVEKAILLYNFRFWLKHNEANRINIHSKDGKNYVWTYNSSSAFAEIFPYFNKNTITRWLRELEKDGILISGNFNRMKYDRTKWYTMYEFITSLPISENE